MDRGGGQKGQGKRTGGSPEGGKGGKRRRGKHGSVKEQIANHRRAGWGGEGREERGGQREREKRVYPGGTLPMGTDDDDWPGGALMGKCLPTDCFKFW
jgi:hypothetical protein